MGSSASADLVAGHAALDVGDWPRAQDAFARALKDEETPEALEGLGLASWWLDRADVVFDARERAYRLYRNRGDQVSAARVAVWIAWDSAAFRGEEGVANGWLQRARRLLEAQPESTAHAFFVERSAIFSLFDEGNPEEAERLAYEAIRIGQAIGVIDHEMVGRAILGLALATTGRVTEGLRSLDEVSAAILGGEMTDRLLIGLAGCYLISACERVRDCERAMQWCQRIKEHSRQCGLRPLFAVCRTQYASVCVWRGAWDEAERELTRACEELAICRPGMTTDGLARLGELRRRQGRLDEASSLFERSGGHPIATLGRAAIALDQGDARNAADAVERHLRRLPAKNRTERAAALEILIRAHAVPTGDRARAQVALRELREIAEAADTAHLLASASLAAGLMAAAEANWDGAKNALEDAVDLFDRSAAPFEAAVARVDLARVLQQLGRVDAATIEVNRALDAFTKLGAARELSAAHVVRDALVSPPPPEAASGDAPPRILSPREIEVLRLISDGLSNQAIAQRLFISEHTVHRHVANTLTKLDVPSRSAAVAQAARLGLL